MFAFLIFEENCGYSDYVYGQTQSPAVAVAVTAGALCRVNANEVPAAPRGTSATRGNNKSRKKRLHQPQTNVRRCRCIKRATTASGVEQTSERSRKLSMEVIS